MVNESYAMLDAPPVFLQIDREDGKFFDVTLDTDWYIEQFFELDKELEDEFDGTVECWSQKKDTGFSSNGVDDLREEFLTKKGWIKQDKVTTSRMDNNLTCDLEIVVFLKEMTDSEPENASVMLRKEGNDFQFYKPKGSESYLFPICITVGICAMELITNVPGVEDGQLELFETGRDEKERELLLSIDEHWQTGYSSWPIGKFEDDLQDIYPETATMCNRCPSVIIKLKEEAGGHKLRVVFTPDSDWYQFS